MKVLDILDLHDFLTAKERTRSADYYFGKNSIIVSYYKITEWYCDKRCMTAIKMLSTVNN